ncbi:hypothetical protein M5689_004551 [Euphorbia peplus]|nr:hypothetical protein M5689_004551 [Euphorbia peplus]
MTPVTSPNLSPTIGKSLRSLPISIDFWFWPNGSSDAPVSLWTMEEWGYPGLLSPSISVQSSSTPSSFSPPPLHFNSKSSSNLQFLNFSFDIEKVIGVL